MTHECTRVYNLTVCPQNSELNMQMLSALCIHFSFVLGCHCYYQLIPCWSTEGVIHGLAQLLAAHHKLCGQWVIGRLFCLYSVHLPDALQFYHHKEKLVKQLSMAPIKGNSIEVDTLPLSK